MHNLLIASKLLNAYPNCIILNLLLKYFDHVNRIVILRIGRMYKLGEHSALGKF